MGALGLRCRDVRTREAGIQDIHHAARPAEVELVRRCGFGLRGRGGVGVGRVVAGCEGRGRVVCCY
jgi:hypothetical protein